MLIHGNQKVLTPEEAGNTMRMETKFLRLRTPLELGSQFSDWSVCWLGGWSKHQLYCLVMLVKLPVSSSASARAALKLVREGVS